MKKIELVEKLNETITKLESMKEDCLNCSDINGFDMERINSTFEGSIENLRCLSEEFAQLEFDEDGNPINVGE